MNKFITLEKKYPNDAELGKAIRAEIRKDDTSELKELAELLDKQIQVATKLLHCLKK